MAPKKEDQKDRVGELEKQLKEKEKVLETALGANETLKGELEEARKDKAFVAGQLEVARKEIEALNASLGDRVAEIEELKKIAVVGDEEVEPELSEADESLILEACEAYGIGTEHVFSSRIEAGAAVIVTNGGARVRYRRGDEVEPLAPIQVDGVIRKKMKPITGGKKKAAKEAENK